MDNIEVRVTQGAQWELQDAAIALAAKLEELGVIEGNSIAVLGTLTDKEVNELLSTSDPAVMGELLTALRDLTLIQIVQCSFVLENGVRRHLTRQEALDMEPTEWNELLARVQAELRIAQEGSAPLVSIEPSGLSSSDF